MYHLWSRLGNCIPTNLDPNHLDDWLEDNLQAFASHQQRALTNYFAPKIPPRKLEVHMRTKRGKIFIGLVFLLMILLGIGTFGFYFQGMTIILNDAPQWAKDISKLAFCIWLFSKISKSVDTMIHTPMK